MTIGQSEAKADEAPATRELRAAAKTRTIAIRAVDKKKSPTAKKVTREVLIKALSCGSVSIVAQSLPNKEAAVTLQEVFGFAAQKQNSLTRAILPPKGRGGSASRPRRSEPPFTPMNVLSSGVRRRRMNIPGAQRATRNPEALSAAVSLSFRLRI